MCGHCGDDLVMLCRRKPKTGADSESPIHPASSPSPSPLTLGGVGAGVKSRVSHNGGDQQTTAALIDAKLAAFRTELQEDLKREIKAATDAIVEGLSFSQIVCTILPKSLLLLGRRCYAIGGLFQSLCLLFVCLPRCVLWPNDAR